jgi:hypothetical protein
MRRNSRSARRRSCRAGGERNRERRGGASGIGAHWCVAAENTLHGGGGGAGGRAGGASVLRAQRRDATTADVGGRWHRTARLWRRRRGEEGEAALGCEDGEAAQDGVDETVVATGGTMAACRRDRIRVGEDLMICLGVDRMNAWVMHPLVDLGGITWRWG